MDIRERRTTAHAQARRSWGRGAKAASREKLLLINEVPAPVLLPARFVAFRAERLFLAVADRLDAVRAYAGSDQSALHCAGSLVAQCDVVFGGAALVAVPLNSEVHVGMSVQELHVGRQGTLLIAADIRLVIVEINVLHILAEQFLVGRRRLGWRRRWRSRHRDAGAGLLRSAGTFRCEVIRSRVRGRNGLRSVGLHRTDAVDGNVGGVAGLPGERGRLPGLDAVRTYGNRSRRSRCRCWWRRRRWRRSGFLAARAQHQQST